MSQKIFVLFSVLMTLSVAAVFYGTHEISVVRTMMDDLIKKEKTYQKFQTNMFVALADHNNKTETLLSTLDAELLLLKRAELRKQEDQLFQFIHNFNSKNSELYEKSYLNLLRKLAILSEKEDRLFMLMENFAQMQATKFFYAEILPLQTEVANEIDLFSRMVTTEFEQNRIKIDREIQQAKQFMVAVIVLLIVAFCFTAILLWHGVIQPIKSLTEYLKIASKDNVPIDFPALKRSDEIGEFTRSFLLLQAERDIAEEQLKEKVTEAESANQAKSDFLANMSHELRTPLNSILGMIQLLEKDELPEKFAEMLNVINVSSGNLLKIVNDILDLSKIEAGETDLAYVGFDLLEEIKKSVDSLRPIASKKGLELNYENGIGDGLFTFGDPLRLSRIIINLVNNAISYTEVGSVSVVTKINTIADHKKEFHLQVIDTGIGIDENLVDQIFDKFTQVDTSNTRKYSGTGLGLAITRELVELMEGEINVNSIKDVGSIFSIKIPFDCVEQLDIEEEAVIDVSDDYYDDRVKVPLSNARILIAEDHQMNVIFLKKIFEHLGFDKYTIVSNGQEAVQEIRRNHYTLVLMDCHMPIMNGYAATQMIRLLDSDKASVPIMAMTANAMKKDIDQCFEIGMDEYIGKPLNLDEFEAKLSRWIDLES